MHTTSRTLLLVLAGTIVLTGYCMFATVVSARIWEPGGLLLLVIALAGQLGRPARCLSQGRRASAAERSALGLGCASLIAAVVGTLAIAMPHSGHPSSAILFFLFPIAVTRLLTPVTILVLALIALRDDGTRFV